MKSASIKLFVCTTVLALGLANSAMAVPVNPINNTTAFVLSGNNGVPSAAPTALADFQNAIGNQNLSVLYSIVIPNGGPVLSTADGGTFAGTYRTLADPATSDVKIDRDPNNAIPIASGYGALYALVVGVASANPDWKAFDITGWDGNATIVFEDTLRSIPDSGGTQQVDAYLTSVYLFGGPASTTGSSTGVPDGGSTGLLLGSALLGLGLFGRRKLS